MASKKKGTVEAYELLVERAKEYQRNYPRAFAGEDEGGVISFTEIFKVDAFEVIQVVCIQVRQVEK